MEVRRPDFKDFSPKQSKRADAEPPAMVERAHGPRAEILPTSMGQGDRDVVYYEPGTFSAGPSEGAGLPTIRVNHNHNHVTRHDDRERNLFLFLVTVIMASVGGLAGVSIAAGFGLPWGPYAGIGAALVALPALAFVLRVASLDPERERHVTERRRDRMQARLQEERDRLEDLRENRRIDIEALGATEKAELARERVQAEKEKAKAEAEQARTDRVRIVEQAQRHGRPQSVNNQLANYVAEPLASPPLESEDIGDARWLNDPPVDEVRVRMLETLVELYDDDSEKVERSGLIVNGYRLPWSKRGGFTESERKQALDILGQLERIGAPLFTYHEGKRRWALSVRRYPTLEEAVEALDEARSRA